MIERKKWRPSRHSPNQPRNAGKLRKRGKRGDIRGRKEKIAKLDFVKWGLFVRSLPLKKQLEHFLRFTEFYAFVCLLLRGTEQTRTVLWLLFLSAMAKLIQGFHLKGELEAEKMRAGTSNLAGRNIPEHRDKDIVRNFLCDLYIISWRLRQEMEVLLNRYVTQF